MLDLLRAGAERFPDRPLIVSARGVFTYADVLADAERIAAGLAQRQVTRLASALRAAEEVVALLAAGAIAGVEICGYPLEEPAETLETLAMRFDHDVVVVGTGSPEVPSARRLPIAELRSDAAVPPAAADPTVLVLTTGTTGERRGAIHKWSRLSPAVSEPAPDATTPRWLLAYNLNQFAGIAILLHVLASGATLVQPTAQRAREGVEAIRAHGVTHVSATPTFWRGILRELGGSADFALEQITLGGEAVPDRLLNDLRACFPSARISQIYAATEFGQSGSVRDGLPGLPESVLHRPADAPVQFRVVDGELHARSRVGMVGYYGEPPRDPDEWRPTGDLVEVRDGRLLFVGRTTEVINVGGVKVHPGPVERAAESVPSVLAASAYGRANPLTGQIVALEVVLAAGAEADAAEAAIREACAELAPAARPRSIKFVDELTTRGQKVNRRLLAEVER